MAIMVRLTLFQILGLLGGAFVLSAVAAADPPKQIRLAYSKDSGMHVSWNTVVKLEQPTVYYGTSPHHLRKKASSRTSVTYKTSTTYNNHVQLSGLKADTEYFYKPEGADEVFSFKTSRAAGNATPFTVAVVVDLGVMGADGLTTRVGNGAANPLKPGQHNTIQSLEESLPAFDFLWHRKNPLKFLVKGQN